MTTIYQNASLGGQTNAATRDAAPHIDLENRNEAGAIMPDTRVPPKAKPVLDAVSVNGEAIAETAILAEAQHHPADTPGEALILSARALVIRALLLQEAESLQMSGQRCDDQIGNRETHQDALVRELIEHEVETPRASDADCHRYFEKNPGKFRSETIYEARHILLSAPVDDSAKRARQLAVAKDLLLLLGQQAGDFDTLARCHSDCPSHQQGGNLGQITRGSTVAEFEKTLAQMEPGSLWPKPVESRFGYHIIFLENRVEGTLLPFDAVKEKIAAWLEAASWSRAVSQYIGVLAGKADIKGISLEASDGPLVQ